MSYQTLRLELDGPVAWLTLDVKEGIAAFLGKRAPEYQDL